MDRNDSQDNGQWDIYQNLTEYTSHLCPSYSVLKKYAVLFFLETVKEIQLIRKFQELYWTWNIVLC